MHAKVLVLADEFPTQPRLSLLATLINVEKFVGAEQPLTKICERLHFRRRFGRGLRLFIFSLLFVLLRF